MSAVAVLALVLAPLGIAQARRGRARNIASFVTIDRVTGDGFIEGRVTSTKPACRDGRVVRISRNNEPKGSVAADRSGFWVANMGDQTFHNDRFVAEIDTVKPRGRHFRCGSDTDVFEFDGGGGGGDEFHHLFVGVAGAGRVDSEPDDGIDNCREDSPPESGNCFEEYPEGTTTTLRATPDEGESFEGWGEACESRGTNPTCTLTMDEQKEATATFSGGGGNGADACPIDPAVPAALRDVLCLVIAVLGG